MKKRISAFILVLVLVLSMSMNVAAADGAELVLANSTNESGQTVVSLSIKNGEGITNGRVSIKYDSLLVKLVSVSVNSDCRFTSVNDESLGKVSFAWVGSDFTAEETMLMELTFETSSSMVGTAVYTAEADEAYADGVAVDVKAAEISQMLTGTKPVTPPVTEPDEPDVPVNPPVTEPDEPDVPAECPFTDIDGHWAEADIEKVYFAGLFNGVEPTLFVPNGEMTRAMFVTVLYRMEGEPETEPGIEFEDVTEGKYYYDAVAWASTVGVTNGVSDTLFAPNRVLSRQEIVTMLYRFAEYKGEDVSGAADLSTYTDNADVSSYAKASFAWAVDLGLINGYPDNTLRPTVSTTRAQVAAILCRYLGL